MNLPAFIPAPAAIGREAIQVLAGALIAAFIVTQIPALKAYVKAAWA